MRHRLSPGARGGSVGPGARAWTTATRHGALGGSWLGGAWVWLALVRRGLIPDCRATRAAIAKRLRRESKRKLKGASAIAGRGGVPVVAAALATVDPDARAILDHEIRRWSAALRDGSVTDVWSGSAGALLGAAEIEALWPRSMPRRDLRRQHASVTRDLALRVSSHAPPHGHLGIAHGVAGLLLGLEASHAAFAFGLPRSLRARAIDYLMERRLRGPGSIAGWPILCDDDSRIMNGWCSGVAGIAMAAMVGHHLSGDAAYLPMIECALPSTFVLRNAAVGDFCCGAIGQVQVLVEAHRLYRDGWLRRARIASVLCHGWRPNDRTFHKGSLGASYLAWRLEHPDQLPLLGLGPWSV